MRGKISLVVIISTAFSLGHTRMPPFSKVFFASGDAYIHSLTLLPLPPSEQAAVQVHTYTEGRKTFVHSFTRLVVEGCIYLSADVAFYVMR